MLVTISPIRRLKAKSISYDKCYNGVDAERLESCKSYILNLIKIAIYCFWMIKWVKKQ